MGIVPAVTGYIEGKLRFNIQSNDKELTIIIQNTANKQNKINEMCATAMVSSKYV